MVWMPKLNIASKYSIHHSLPSWFQLFMMFLHVKQTHLHSRITICLIQSWYQLCNLRYCDSRWVERNFSWSLRLWTKKQQQKICSTHTLYKMMYREKNTHNVHSHFKKEQSLITVTTQYWFWNTRQMLPGTQAQVVGIICLAFNSNS